jgi:hypothetical protein
MSGGWSQCRRTTVLGCPCHKGKRGRLPYEHKATWLLFALLLRPAGACADERPTPWVSPPLAAAPTDPAPGPPLPAPLAAGQAVTLRVLQVLPADGLSPGERLLNGCRDIRPGDRFVAEVIDPPCPQALLVGGKVTKIVKPGWFGRPGYVAVEFIQLAQAPGAPPASWPVDLADRRWSERLRRTLIAALLTTDGVIAGASIGAQLSQGHPTFISGGMGVGAVVGLAYASLQRGVEARLEPGDTFRIVVGTCHYRPIPGDWQTILYPARPPEKDKGKWQK